MKIGDEANRAHGEKWGILRNFTNTNISHRQAFQIIAPAKFPIRFFFSTWGILKKHNVNLPQSPPAAAGIIP